MAKRISNSKLKVSELAQLAGVAPDTVRYYERIGLLPPAPRSASGYRSYEPDQAERIKFIRSAQKMGLKLSEISELVALQDRGLCPCGHADGLIRARIADIDDEIERLSALRAELGRLLEQRNQSGSCTTELIEEEVKIWPLVRADVEQ